MDASNLSRFKRICVFCGSSSGTKSSYRDAATKLASELVQVVSASGFGYQDEYLAFFLGAEMLPKTVERKIDLVYGGGSIGLMGHIAQKVHDGGGHVIGVIPKALMPREICGETVGELIAVDDMHQRKAEMARQADGFIALPGGYGTLEELLEVVTWSQLGIHAKPVGVLNVDGYYNSLLDMFDKGLEEGFLSLSARHIVVSAATACELLNKMEVYAPVQDLMVPTLCWESNPLNEMPHTQPAGTVVTSRAQTQTQTYLSTNVDLLNQHLAGSSLICHSALTNLNHCYTP